MTNEELGERLKSIGEAYTRKAMDVRIQNGMQDAVLFGACGIVMIEISNILLGKKTPEEITAFLNSKET